MTSFALQPLCSSIFTSMWTSFHAVITDSIVKAANLPTCNEVLFIYPSKHYFFILPLGCIFCSWSCVNSVEWLYSICAMLSPRSSPNPGGESAVSWFIQFWNLWNPQLTLFQQGCVSLDWNNFILDSEQNEMLRFKKPEESSYYMSQRYRPGGKIDDSVTTPTS